MILFIIIVSSISNFMHILMLTTIYSIKDYAEIDSNNWNILDHSGDSHNAIRTIISAPDKRIEYPEGILQR